MKRLKKEKEKKVRVNITLDESVYIRYGLYIENLSAFLNTTLKNYLERKENELLSSEGSTSDGYVQYLKRKQSNAEIDSMLGIVTNEPKIKDYPKDYEELARIAKTSWIKDFDK